MTIAKGQIAFHGLHVWQEGNIQKEEPAVYNADWPSLNGGESAEARFTVNGDKDFILQYMTRAQRDASVAALQIEVKDQGGYSIFGSPVYVDQVTGTAGQPYILPMKRLFRRTGTVTVKYYADGDA